jgi:hypothetical protein
MRIWSKSYEDRGIPMPIRTLPEVVLSPEARTLFCRQFGKSPAEADALLAEQNAERSRAFTAWVADHPGGTLQEFLSSDLEETLFELGVDTGLSEVMARRTARRKARLLLRG